MVLKISIMQMILMVFMISMIVMITIILSTLMKLKRLQLKQLKLNQLQLKRMTKRRRMMPETGVINASVSRNAAGGYSEYSPWLYLAAGIVKQAADDYVIVLRKLWRKTDDIKTKRDLIVKKAQLEDFFYSSWYQTLTDIDPDKLIYQCRITAKKKEKAAIQRDNQKKIKELLMEED